LRDVPGVARLLKGLEGSNPKAKGLKLEDHAELRIVREIE